TPSPQTLKQESADQQKQTSINVVDQLKQDTRTADDSKDEKKQESPSTTTRSAMTNSAGGQFIVTQTTTARTPLSQQSTTVQKKPVNSSTFRQLYQKFTKGKVQVFLC